MDSNKLNIEYHRGWVEEKNPEPEKFHNYFNRHGIVFGGGDMSDQMQKDFEDILEGEKVDKPAKE